MGPKSGIVRPSGATERVCGLPRTRQRLIVFLAVLVGGCLWVWSSPGLGAADGSSGISLLSGRWHPLTATVVVTAAGLPAIGFGLVAAASGNSLWGLFTVAASLCVLAAHGGGMHGWLRRHEQLPGDYLQLILEMFVWQAGLILMLILIRRSRPHLRRRWPVLVLDDRPDQALVLRLCRPWSVGPGLTCAGVAATVAFFLIRNSDAGQVIGALLVAFTLGGWAAKAVWSGYNCLTVLASPALVAVGAYAWVLLHFGGADAESVLSAWYLQEGAGAGVGGALPGLALALPIHYISAGLVGCCLGLGLGGEGAGDDDQHVQRGAAADLWRKLKGSEQDNPSGSGSDAERSSPAGKGRP